MFWSKNKQLTSQEYEALMPRIAKLEQDSAALRYMFDKMETNYNSLRGLMNRKLGGSQQNLTAEPDDKLMKDIEELARFTGLSKESIIKELGIK